jgi:hypothetical protein
MVCLETRPVAVGNELVDGNRLDRGRAVFRFCSQSIVTIHSRKQQSWGGNAVVADREVKQPRDMTNRIYSIFGFVQPM